MTMTEERVAGSFRLRANTQTREVSGFDPTYRGAKLHFIYDKYAVIQVPGTTEYASFVGPMYLSLV